MPGPALSNPDAYPLEGRRSSGQPGVQSPLHRLSQPCGGGDGVIPPLQLRKQKPREVKRLTHGSTAGISIIKLESQFIYFQSLTPNLWSVRRAQRFGQRRVKPI